MLRELHPSEYKLSPSAARLRGFPAIGVELAVADPTVTLEAIASGDVIVRCVEQRDGKVIGELAISIFRAALVIDRDGILAERAEDAARDALAGRLQPAVPVALPGASGYRAEVAVPSAGGAALPYLYAFAIAPDDLGVDGGAIAIVRCARPEWPAGNAILATLRVLGRSGKRAAAGDPDAVLALPMASRSRR